MLYSESMNTPRPVSADNLSPWRSVSALHEEAPTSQILLGVYQHPSIYDLAICAEDARQMFCRELQKWVSQPQLRTDPALRSTAVPLSMCGPRLSRRLLVPRQSTARSKASTSQSEEHDYSGRFCWRWTSPCLAPDLEGYSGVGVTGRCSLDQSCKSNKKCHTYSITVVRFDTQLSEYTAEYCHRMSRSILREVLLTSAGYSAPVWLLTCE
jgi:hypothetical protein